MGCHPSHWLSYFSRWLKPPTRLYIFDQRSKIVVIVEVLVFLNCWWSKVLFAFYRVRKFFSCLLPVMAVPWSVPWVDFPKRNWSSIHEKYHSFIRVYIPIIRIPNIRRMTKTHIYIYTVYTHTLIPCFDQHIYRRQWSLSWFPGRLHMSMPVFWEFDGICGAGVSETW